MYIDGKLNFEVGGHIIQIDHDAFTTAGSIFLRHKNSNNYVPIDISEAYGLEGGSECWRRSSFPKT